MKKENYGATEKQVISCNLVKNIGMFICVYVPSAHRIGQGFLLQSQNRMSLFTRKQYSVKMCFAIKGFNKELSHWNYFNLF